MFHSENSLEFLAPANEPGHEARFREELDQPAPVEPKVEGEIHDVDAALIMARHMANAGTFVRFI